MLTVVLLGELGKRFGRKHRLDVRSPAEAVRALCANFRDFRQFVATSEQRNVAYRVLSHKDEVGLEELHNPASKTITFVPVVSGAIIKTLKKLVDSTVGKIIIGAALIAASVLTFGAATPLLTGVFGQVAFSVGVSLALGGVAQLLAPTPKTRDQEVKSEASYIFNGAVNTTAQGAAIPVGYGRLIVGSAVISAGVSVEDVTA